VKTATAAQMRAMANKPLLKSGQPIRYVASGQINGLFLGFREN
jgi:hypothetical protein